MDTLSIVALLMLLLLAALIGVLIWFLGGLPGRVAAARNHPQTQAIQVGGWATLLLGIAGWPFVLMWAYWTPASNVSDVQKQTSESTVDDNPSDGEGGQN